MTFCWRVERPLAASSAVPSASSGVQVRSAPACRSRSAARRWEAEQACQNACEISSRTGSRDSSSSTRANLPSAAACHSLSMRTPLAASKSATCHHPWPIALSRGSPIDPSGASASVPASNSVCAISASSLLAAQCSGVPPFLPSPPPWLGPAPRAIRRRTTSGPYGQYPGQSVVTCSSVLPRSPAGDRG